MINDVQVKELKVIPDEHGRFMEILRSDDDGFDRFGQTYMMSVHPGVVKGWHYHKKQVDHFVCVHGMIKLALYDMRDESSTHGEVDEFFIGTYNPLLVKVPIRVAHGIKGIGTHEAIVINVPTELYDRKDPDKFSLPLRGGEILYDWDHVDR